MRKLGFKTLSETRDLHIEDWDYLKSLPEKVIQFGTGVLLRGLPDFIIDQANRQRLYAGRIVMVKSTDRGDISGFIDQNCLYTVCVRGIAGDKTVEEDKIISSVSRVLTANLQWEEVLKLSESEALETVISNTTEIGITLVKEKVVDRVPDSFPGKLLAVLYHRYLHFNGDKDRGLVIIPTELISDNGDYLKSVILELAAFNELGEDFITWIESANTFCNSLVDRIVPGAPRGVIADNIKAGLSYEDPWAIMCEPYMLWAISGDEKVKEKLGFIRTDIGAFVEPDINKYKELKLRLLNGSHTLTCALGYLGDYGTVKDAMADEVFLKFIRHLMFHEIAPAIPFALKEEEKTAFANQVIDRFRNPFIEHYWLNITLNFTQKIRLRVLPLLMKFIKDKNRIPEAMALGIAAFIRFMKPVSIEGKQVFGEHNGEKYLIQDQQAAEFVSLFEKHMDSDSLVRAVLGNNDFRDINPAQNENLVSAVTFYYNQLAQKGVKRTIEKLINEIKINF